MIKVAVSGNPVVHFAVLNENIQIPRWNVSRLNVLLRGSQYSGLGSVVPLLVWSKSNVAIPKPSGRHDEKHESDSCDNSGFCQIGKAALSLIAGKLNFRGEGFKGKGMIEF